MTDKPKSLYEQLTELAEWLEKEGREWVPAGDSLAAQDYFAKAADVRAMAER